MFQDFDALEDGERITLHPRPDNPLHKRPVQAMHTGGYFYCDGSPLHEGPDYYVGDVLRFCEGYTRLPDEPLRDAAEVLEIGGLTVVK